MRKFTFRLWAVLMLMLVSMQTMATDTFTSNRTDFRDESIYFMMTTRFYDGDTGNNVLCWDNQSEQIKTKDPCWRGDFQHRLHRLFHIQDSFSLIPDRNYQFFSLNPRFYVNNSDFIAIPMNHRICHRLRDRRFHILQLLHRRIHPTHEDCRCDTGKLLVR